MKVNSRKKAERAAEVFQSMGFKSVGVTGTGDSGCIVLSADDAMKLLLLTEEDTVAALDHDQRVRNTLAEEIANTRKLLTRMEQISTHKFTQCKMGDHVIDSYVTGGRDGHVITRCLVCDFKQEGWD